MWLVFAEKILTYKTKFCPPSVSVTPQFRKLLASQIFYAYTKR